MAAGVAASPLGKKLGVPVDRAGRVAVEPDLSLPDHPEVFVIGDLAALKDEAARCFPASLSSLFSKAGTSPSSFGMRLPGRPKHRAMAQPLPRPGFHYWDKGSLATIGRAAAVAEFGKLHISADRNGWLGCSVISFS